MPVASRTVIINATPEKVFSVTQITTTIRHS